MKNQIFFIAKSGCGLILTSALLSGCSNEPTVGDLMMNQGTGTAELGKLWSAGKDKFVRGQTLTSEGNEMIEEARKEMREGEDKIIEGKKLMQEGKQQMDDTEKTYKSRFPGSYQKIFLKPG
jgi:hypothetical protein